MRKLMLAGVIALAAIGPAMAQGYRSYIPLDSVNRTHRYYGPINPYSSSTPPLSAEREYWEHNMPKQCWKRFDDSLTCTQ